MTGSEEQLRQRAERERRARVEAETIAERELRRVYRQTRELDLLAGVTVDANQANTLEECLAGAVERVRAYADFAVGHVWRRGSAGMMESTEVWSSADEAGDFLDIVRDASRGSAFADGHGLIGRVAGSRQALWLSDVSEHDFFQRQDQLAHVAAFAFPVMSGDQAVAVFEFLDSAPKPVDTRLLELTSVVGKQLGRVFERDRALAERARFLAEESANQAKASFLASVSHELRTPLHVILASLEAAASHAPGESYGDELRDAQEAAERLQLLVDRLLAVIDVPADGGEVQWDRIVPLQILRESIAPWSAEPRLSLGEVGAGLVTPVLQDGDQVRAVLYALIENAITHTEGPVEVTATRFDDLITWEVSDRGPGLSSDPHALMSEPLNVPLGESRRPSGLWLGLPAAARAAANVGGSLDLVPRHGGGLVARLVTPVRDAAAPAGDETAARTILLVDDSMINRRITSAMLERLGLDTVSAADGEEALTKMQSEEFALVLMDVQMPVLDGFAATRRHRLWEAENARSPVPIVAVTAHVGPAEQQRCFSAGMNDYLSKPFAARDIEVLVRRWAPAALKDGPSDS